MVTGNTRDYVDFSGGEAKEVNYVFFATRTTRITAATCPGSYGGPSPAAAPFVPYLVCFVLVSFAVCLLFDSDYGFLANLSQAPEPGNVLF